MNIETVRSIEYHYEHAKKKHPHFCDGILPTEVPDPYFPKTKVMERDEMMAEIGSKLSSRRNRIESGYKYHNLLWNEILDCEVWEITEAMANGNTEHAVEECYDAIAVLLRTIDVIRGRKRLGRSEEGGANSCVNIGVNDKVHAAGSIMGRESINRQCYECANCEEPTDGWDGSKFRCAFLGKNFGTWHYDVPNECPCKGKGWIHKKKEGGME